MQPACTSALMVDMEVSVVAAVALSSGIGITMDRALVDPAGLTLAPAVLVVCGPAHPHVSVIV
ncbi:MAG: hypothetical protein WBR15_08615 [Gammaproteobacteria bacterium]